MKKILLALIAILPFVVYGQTAVPAWSEALYREMNYPSQEWYTGFAHDHLKAGADAVDALKILERESQNRLAEGIIVAIDGTSRTENTSSQWRNAGQRSEIITTNYKQAIGTATSATVVKTDVKSFHNPLTGELYAFAAVRRSELSAFYAKQMDVDLNKAEIAVEVSGQLVAAGKKMSARLKVEEAKQVLGNISFYRDLLIAVDAEANENKLQSTRGNEIDRIVEQLLIDLEQSTFIHIDASGDEVGIFSDIIAQALSENGCSIVDNNEEADYELTLTTSTTQRSSDAGQLGIRSYYANVKVVLYNRLTHRRVSEFSILNDPDAYSVGRTQEDAIAKAFKRPAIKSKVMEVILTKINN